MIKPASVAIFITLAVSAPAVSGGDGSRQAYYAVGGSTAAEIYESIRQSSPRIAPNAVFAFTAVATKTDNKLAKSEGRCAYRSFVTSGYYVFYLPRHQSPERLASPLLSRWRSFGDYLLKHEQGHRDIWRQCLAAYDKAALSLSAANCEELDRRRDKTFERIKRSCVRKDEAYDFTFRREVRHHPFVQDALQGK